MVVKADARWKKTIEGERGIPHSSPVVLVGILALLYCKQELVILY